MENTAKKEMVRDLLKKNILISPDFFESADVQAGAAYNNSSNQDVAVLDKELGKLMQKGNLGESNNINWLELEKAKALLEKKKDTKTYGRFIQYMTKPPEETKPTTTTKADQSSQINTTWSYKEEAMGWEVQDFVLFFNARYKALEKILRARQEMQNPVSIARIAAKKEKEAIALIGIVKDKQTTKNDNIILTLEDQSGEIAILVSKNKPELAAVSKNIVMDEVIGVRGVNGDRIVFANNIVFPDIPSTKGLKKAKDDAYAVFLSDLHVGSKNFLPEKFNKFLDWINGESGSEAQREIAKKAKYLFIVGDLIDGVGVYPNQEAELAISDVYDQYNECARLLLRIPKHIQLIICGGNHDATRIAEPQPMLPKDFAKAIWALPNAFITTNPALINIHSSEGFEGFDVLMYHGYSFDYYIANVDEIRNQGGYDRADLIMKFLLQKRHLAPTHTSTLYMPNQSEDPLVISMVPDFFVSGHIHKSSVATYRNVTMICGSCWQSKTSFQERVGHHPEPARVPVINLKTRDVKILRF